MPGIFEHKFGGGLTLRYILTHSKLEINYAVHVLQITSLIISIKNFPKGYKNIQREKSNKT